MRIPRRASASFRSQLVLTTMALTALGMVVVTLGLQLILHRIIEGNLDRVLHDRADSVVAAVDAASGPRLVVPGEVLDPGVRVYDAQGRPIAGSQWREVHAEASSLSRVSTPRSLDVGERFRLYARPFTTSSGRDGTVVVSESRHPYEEAELYILLTSLAVGVLVVAAVGLITRWVTSRALAPVAQMAERAADWSEHDLGRRFDLGPPTNEISSLGATLDALLERVAMTIRAEQRLTAELAHELRTPLAAIQGSADLALLRGGLSEDARTDLEQVAASSRTMAETITTLLDLARSAGEAPAATCRLGEVLDAVRPAGSGGEGPAWVESVPDRTLRVAAPRDLAVRAISPVVENALRHARTTVMLSAVASAAAVELRVHDDGPGVDPAVRETLFAPGTTGAGGGTGLGLGIARRVARTIGGDVELAADEEPGATFVVRLPRL